MLRKSFVSGLVCFVALALATIQTLSAEDSLVGKNIFPKSRDVTIQIGGKIIGRESDLSYPLTVRKVQGNWLWIWADAKKCEGWIRRNDVCTTAESISYFSDKIRRNSNDDHAYWMRSMAHSELGNHRLALEDANR